MKKVAVVIDDWKLPIFCRILLEGGYTFEEIAGPGPRVITLKISTHDVARLYDFVKRANEEAKVARMPENTTTH